MAHQATELATLANAVSRGVQEARGNEQNFFIMGEEVYTVYHARSIEASLGALKKFTKAISDADLAKKVEAIGADIHNYAADFAKIVALKKQSGIGWEEGLLPKVRREGDALDALGLKSKDSGVLAGVVNMRRTERSFLTELTPRFVFSMKNEARLTVEAIDKAPLP